MANLTQVASNLAMQGANKAVRSITLETNLTPPLTIPPFAQGEPGAPAEPSKFSLMGFLQPKLTLDTIAGPIKAAPAGDPNPYGWMIAVTVLGLAIVGGITTIGVIARKMK